ncbi:MAG: Flp family type IVb pilin [Acetobacteraceae bacterium]|jgi:pilus assembly protein Flp/PilA
MRTLALQRFIGRFAQDDSGSNALEYGLIVGLISLAIVAGAGAAGTALGNIFSAIGNKIGTEATTITT